MTTTLSLDLAVAEIGCGVAGAVAGRHLSRVGARVTHLCVATEATNDTLCDLTTGPFEHFMLDKRIVAVDDPIGAGDRLAHEISGCDVVIWDGPLGTITLQEVLALAPRAVILVVTAVGGGDTPATWADGAEAEAASGILGTTGYEDIGPVPLGFLFAEVNGGIRGAAAVMERLLVGRTGLMDEDRVIELSLADCCVEAMENPLQEFGFGGRAFPLSGSHRGGMMPYGIFEGRDGYIGLVAGSGAWERFATSIGRADLADDPRLSSIEGRIVHRNMLINDITAWVNSCQSVDDAVAIVGNDAISARVLTLNQVADLFPELFERTVSGSLVPGNPYVYDE